MAELDDFLALNEQLKAAGDQPSAAEVVPATEPTPAPPADITEFLALNEQLKAEADPAVSLDTATLPTQEPAPSPQQPERINLFDDSGKLVSAPAADVQRLVDDYGYQTPEMAEYGTAGQQALTFAEGLGRGVSFGASDVIAQTGAGLVGAAMDDVPRAAGRGIDAGLLDESAFGRAYSEAGQDIAARQEVNPGTALAGEITGVVGASLATGGAGAVAQGAAYTPAGATAVLGAKVEQALAAKLGKGIAGRIGALAGAGAAEGAVQSAAQAVIDDVKAGDFEITAERALAGGYDLVKEALSGALLGGAAGGAIGSVVEGVGAVGRGLGGLPSVRQLAGDSAYKAAMGRTSKSAVKAAERHGGAAAVGRTLLDEGIPLTGPADELFAALDTRADEVGSQLGGMVREATELSGGKGPSRKALWDAIESDVLKPLRDSPVNRDIAESMDNQLGALKDELTRAQRPVMVRGADGSERVITRDSIGFDELNALRKELDKRIKWDKFTPDAALDARKAIRNTIEDYWIKTADDMASASGRAGFADDLKALKRKYAHLALARDQAEERVITELANRSTSLTDTLVGAATGAGAGDPITGFLASQLHKYVRERGRGYVARGLDAISKLSDRAVKQEQSVARAVKDTVKAAARSTIATPVRVTSIAAQAIPRLLSDSRALADANSPERQRLNEQLAVLADESPELASALEAKALGTATFIASKAGPAIDDTDPFQTRPRPMDRVKARQLARYADAIKSPTGALDRLARGVGTPEDKEVLLALYPRIYQRYVDGVVAELAKVKEPPDRKTRQRLRFATGTPMAREQRPEAIAFFQQSAARAAESSNPEAEMAPAVSPGKARFSTDRDDRMGARSDALLSNNDD